MSRLDGFLDRLRTFYGVLPAPPRDAFGVFVWQILDARCAAHKRDLVLAALKRIPALTPDAVAHAPQGKLEGAVRLSNSSVEQRLEALRNGADVFRRAPRLPAVLQGPLPAARRALALLPHSEAADFHRLLLFSGEHLILPVDVRVARVGARLGYGAPSPSPSTRRIRRALEAELSPSADAYRLASVYLSHHGAATCVDRSPHCVVCPLAAECPGRESTSAVDVSSAGL